MTGRVDEATRIMHAPPPAVFGAFETEQALAAWLPPAGMTGEVFDFEFREGGGYRMRLTYRQPGQAHGKTTDDADEVEVRLLALAPGSRIEQAVVFDSEKPEFAGTMKMTWSFEAVDGGTAVTVRCEDVPDGIRPEDHEAGLTSSLANLARFVERGYRLRDSG